MSNAKLSNALAISHTGFWEWDLLVNQVHRSPETLAIYGLDPESATVNFETAAKLIHPEDRQFVAEYVGAALRDPNESSYELDFRILRPDGQTRAT